MSANYDIEFEKVKKQTPIGSTLLLHVCCAPCATYCLTRLLDKFDVTLYYSNDNITNFDEWQKRLGEVQKLVDIVNNGQFEVANTYPLKLVVQHFDNERFFDVAKGLEREKEGGPRCNECFKLRLGDTWRYAVEHGFDYFAATLSVSPYKNSQTLNQVGLSFAQGPFAEWLPSDFKKHNGYNESVRLSNKYDLYRQHYCGCEFSQRATKVASNLSYVSLRNAPHLKNATSQWFSSKWGIPVQSYLECIESYLDHNTEYGWYVCLHQDNIVGGLGVIENDFHERKDLFPNVCAVFVEENYRNNGIAGKLLDIAVKDLNRKGISPVYLVTDHIGFYERYGWEFLCMVLDDKQQLSRMYVHK